MISLAEFLEKSTRDIADIVRDRGPHVCVFPINGTRRWFLLEKGSSASEMDAEDLVAATANELRRLVAILFDHGVDTVLTPVYGRDLVAERGSVYHQLAKQGLRLLTERRFRAFYAEEAVRVRFYGDYERDFEDEPELLRTLHETEDATADYTHHRLFYGVCGESAVRPITERAATLGRSLSHEEAIEAFYGEPVALADLFIGFDAPTAFDMPLLDKGGVDLYFTRSPSPYLDQTALRAILYDWIFVRSTIPADYSGLQPSDWASMRAYYRKSRRDVIGMGRKRNGIWYAADANQGLSPKVSINDGR